MAATASGRGDRRWRRRVLLAVEAPRALFEASTLPAALPWLRLAPRGDGHAVLVLPGFWADDSSTRVLRAYLRGRGYYTHRWALGRNRGLPDGVSGRLLDRLNAIGDRSGGRRVSLIGWSMGGVYARELAKLAPERVRQVITLGSPFGGGGPATYAPDWMLRMVYGAGPSPHERSAPALGEPPPVPSTAITSRSDGIAGSSACREVACDRTDNVEVVASHVGLGFHPFVLYAIADRLALPEGTWRPFDRSGVRRLFYR